MEEVVLKFDPIREEIVDVVVPYSIDVIGAIVILIVGWIAAGIAQRWILAIFRRLKQMDATLKPLLASMLRYLILVITVVAVLSQFGVQIASIVAVLGAAGLAIGLALQGTLQNIAAGIMLLFLRPFRVQDYIDAEGTAGTVEEIGLFTTQLTTFDGIYVSCPNSKLWNARIVNYSRNKTRRLDVPVGVAYGDDIGAAKSVLGDLLQDDRVLSDPPAQVLVTELADSAVVVNLRCWVDASDYWDMRFHLHEAAKMAIDKAGLSIPFPQRDVHFYQQATVTQA